MYDGTYAGFLSAVFEVYLLKLQDVHIVSTARAQDNLFAARTEVMTLPENSNRVRNKLKKLLGAAAYRSFYHAYLSELPDCETHLLNYCSRVFSEGAAPAGDYGDPTVLWVAKAAKILHREKHRMEAFVRFHLIDNDLYFANVEPDCNVLPVIASHFERRYADQKWVIYDLKRDYGIFYDLETVQEVTMDLQQDGTTTKGLVNDGGFSISRFRESENLYRDLWHRYFKSVNIESRKNMRLHLQHIPKRYWKYMSEKG